MNPAGGIAARGGRGRGEIGRVTAVVRWEGKVRQRKTRPRRRVSVGAASLAGERRRRPIAASSTRSKRRGYHPFAGGRTAEVTSGRAGRSLEFFFGHRPCSRAFIFNPPWRCNGPPRFPSSHRPGARPHWLYFNGPPGRILGAPSKEKGRHSPKKRRGKSRNIRTSYAKQKENVP